MKVLSITTKSFRALDDLTVTFDPVYSAISGTNNCGKSSLINALRLLIGEEDSDYGPAVNASVRNDFSNWKMSGKAHPKDAEVQISGRFSCDQKADASLVGFMARILQLQETDISEFEISLLCKLDGDDEVHVKVGDTTFSGQPAAEVRRRFREGTTLIYHNSPTDGVRARFYHGIGQLSELSKVAQSVINQSRDELSKKLRRATASQQARLQSLIEKLSDKLTVQVELPVSFGYVPFNLALSHGNASVPLGGWGSGTQNKTLILLALVRAAQSEEMESSTDRLTPIILIEEPESFLHPTAQSEFGTALINLAQQLNVQVIVATHSVSFLNTSKPSSNILLERDTFRGKPRGTRLVSVDQENWMEPFANLLGYSDAAFKPWHDAMSMRGQKVLLVEGDIDRRYLTRIQHEEFEKNRLNPDIKIFPYNGADNLKNEAILKLVIDLSDRCVVTCDLDAIEKVKKTLILLKLEEGKNFGIIGKGDGKGAIEDYVPKSIHEKVFADNPSIVSKLMGSSNEARSTKSEMKLKICEYFMEHAKPESDYTDFLNLAKRLNKMFAS